MTALLLAWLAAGSVVMGPPLIVGHRGTGADRPWNPYPENSLPSIAQAFAECADLVEIDVRLDACGRPILWHNPKVPVDGKRLPVSEVPLEEFPPLVGPTGITADVPTFQQALELALTLGQRRRVALVELKSHDGDEARCALVEAVAEVLVRYHAVDRVIVVSSDAVALELMEDRLTGIETGFIAVFPWQAWSQVHTMCNSQATRIEWILLRQVGGIACIPPDHLIGIAGEKGIHVGVWTVNQAQRMRRMAEQGFELIITDEPDLAHGVFHAELAPAVDEIPTDESAHVGHEGRALPDYTTAGSTP